MIHLFDGLQDLRSSTEILEALDWDEQKYQDFMEELRRMLAAAPLSVEKALFWLRNTPWEVFDRQKMPDKIFAIIQKDIKRLEVRMKAQLGSNDFNGDGWN